MPCGRVMRHRSSNSDAGWLNGFVFFRGRRRSTALPEEDEFQIRLQPAETRAPKALLIAGGLQPALEQRFGMTAGGFALAA